MHHFKSPAAFYGAVFVLSAWTAMLFGLSANQLLVSHYEGAVYSALSLDAVTAQPPAPVDYPSDRGLVGGVIAPTSRYLASATPVMLEFATEGGEQYEVIKTGGVSQCDVDSFGSSAESVKKCEPSTGTANEKGRAVVINKAPEWANALPGSSWISFKKGSASTKSGIADGTVVRFTKKVSLPAPVSSGVIAVMADDNVRVFVNGAKVYGTGSKNRALVKQPEIISLGSLKKGENVFAFEVTQSDRANNKPFGLNAKILLLQTPASGLTQTIASGSEAVRLATTLFLSVAPQQDLRSLAVTLTREGNPWSYGSDAITKDFRNIRLVDESTGVVLAAIPEITTSAGCSIAGKTATCTFGSVGSTRTLHAITATGFGQVRGLSLYADVLPTNTTKAMTVKILQGKNNLFRTDAKTLLDTPPSTPYTITLTPASSPVVAACVDGIDNDGDGRIDADDVGCQAQNLSAALDDNEADDTAVLREAAAARNTARANALKQIADAVDSFLRANGGRWECAAGPLPLSSRTITTQKNGYALASCLVPQYIAQLPVDPGTAVAGSAAKYFWNDAADYNTGFNLAYSSVGKKITFYAFNAELGQQIRYDYTIAFETETVPTPAPVTPTAPGGAIDVDTRPAPEGPVLTVATVAGPAVTKVVPGTASVELARFSLSADAKSDLVVTKIALTKTPLGGAAGDAFTGYSLHVGSNRLTAAPIVTSDGSATLIDFTVSNFVIPKGQTRTLVARAAVLSTGAGVGSRNVFSVDGAKIVAAAKNTSAVVEVRGSATSGTLEVTPLTVSLGKSVNGATTNRVRSLSDDVINLSITGSTVSATSLRSLKLYFAGTALGSAFRVSLVGPRKEALSGVAAQTCTPDAAGTCSVTFTSDLAIERSKTVGAKILIDSSNFNNVAGSGETLEVSILALSDITFDKGAVIPGLAGTLLLAQLQYQ